MQETSDKFMRVLGEIIQSHRKELQKSIYAISAESALSKSTWREIELGICQDVKLKSLWKISEGLNISAGDILIELAEKLGPDFILSDLD